MEKEKLREEDEGELPMTFSVSQSGTYKRCPRIYKYRYLYGIPTKPKPYFDFGATLHRVVESITRLEARGRGGGFGHRPRVPGQVLEDRGYTSKEQERRDYEEAKRILEVFLEENARVRGETVGMEKKFTVNLDGSDRVGLWYLRKNTVVMVDVEEEDVEKVKEQVKGK